MQLRTSTEIDVRRFRTLRSRRGLVAVSLILLTAATMVVPSTSGASTKAKTSARVAYPEGIVNSSEPSGEAPPTTSQLSGYSLSSVTTFSGASLPAGWETFAGNPGGDSGAQWAASHVVVSGGLLQLNAWKDAAYGNEWVTGGVCECTRAQTYGAYFVRSRVTGPGPTQVELLWPTSGWPPEIDFNETSGSVSSSMATDHFGSNNAQIQRTVHVNMEQWHTWGVIWTPTSITYTVDGTVWGTVTGAGAIPNQPMTLHIQQQTWCSSNSGCPTSNQSTQVNWVAEYKPLPQSSNSTQAPPPSHKSSGHVVIHPFKPHSTELTTLAKEQVRTLAREIVENNDATVTLTGACSSVSSASSAALSRRRTVTVEHYLDGELARLNASNIAVRLSDVSIALVSVGHATSQGCTRRVVVNLS